MDKLLSSEGRDESRAAFYWFQEVLLIKIKF